MADDIPAALKQGDATIFKCATRAAQLQSAEPIVAYWCEYWVVNQILAKQLHTTSEEVLSYTTKLMDKLEQIKEEYANNDAIIDDDAGQAYIEKFAQQTLDRAERVIKANRVTQQTANTFDAAATFFQLVNIWGPPDEETQQKIKYAKWNAARIIKAIKEGKDPNESNPRREEAAQEPAAPPLDPNDPEVRMLSAPGGPGPRPVTVEDVPDTGSDVKRDAAGVSLPHSPVSAVPPPAQDDLQLPSAPSNFYQPPAEPGYFDNHPLPSPVSPPTHNPVNYHPQDIPPPPVAWTPTPPPPASHPAYPPPSHDQFRPTPSPPAAPPTFTTSPFVPTPAVAPPPPINHSVHPGFPSVAPNADPLRQQFLPPGPSTGNLGIPSIAPAYAAPRAAPHLASNTVGNNTMVDDKSMAQAQKHARWAISALNFEDVNTAVRELRNALQSLGAI